MKQLAQPRMNDTGKHVFKKIQDERKTSSVEPWKHTFQRKNHDIGYSDILSSQKSHQASDNNNPTSQDVEDKDRGTSHNSITSRLEALGKNIQQVGGEIPATQETNDQLPTVIEEEVSMAISNDAGGNTKAQGQGS